LGLVVVFEGVVVVSTVEVEELDFVLVDPELVEVVWLFTSEVYTNVVWVEVENDTSVETEVMCAVEEASWVVSGTEIDAVQEEVSSKELLLEVCGFVFVLISSCFVEVW